MENAVASSLHLGPDQHLALSCTVPVPAKRLVEQKAEDRGDDSHPVSFLVRLLRLFPHIYLQTLTRLNSLLP